MKTNFKHIFFEETYIKHDKGETGITKWKIQDKVEKGWLKSN